MATFVVKGLPSTKTFWKCRSWSGSDESTHHGCLSAKKRLTAKCMAFFLFEPLNNRKSVKIATLAAKHAFFPEESNTT